MVRTVTRRGKRRLVIDFTYRKPDGSKGRYRHDAEVQTMPAARAEERRRLAALAATGSPFEVVNEAARDQVAPPAPVPVGPTFREVADRYIATFMPSNLKPSTAFAYRFYIDKMLVPRLGDRLVAEINASTVRALDTELVRGGMGVSTRRKVWVVLRSILGRFAVEAGFLSEAPKLPKLPRSGATITNVLTRDEVGRLLHAARPHHRLAFMLAALAGLRAGEVRGLRVCDVDLTLGRLVVRQNVFRGVRSTPKSGHERAIPLAPVLREALQALPARDRSAPVALTASGKPWGDNGIRESFKRVAERAGLDPAWRFHDLRHFFVTELFRCGVSAPTVQRLAGHSSLAVTQRYAHVVKDDLDAAIGRLSAGRPEGAPGAWQ